MEFKQTIIKSLAAGFLISLGGTCFLSVHNKIIGAFLFSVGLLSICVTDQYLFTGKVSYTNDFFFLYFVLGLNWLSAFCMGIFIRNIRPDLIERAELMCANKLSEGLLVVPLGILCNILIYFAVEGYKNNSWVLLILCVMAFILCGFEHCIANIFYFSVTLRIPVVYILLNILGNTLGGVIVFNLRRIVK